MFLSCCRKSLGVWFALLLGVFATWAQTGGGSGGGGGTPTRPPSTPVAPTPTPSTPSVPVQPPSEVRRPVFFSGRVVVDDGTPPPDYATIEMVCNGLRRPQAYTDSKGHFSFQVGQNQGSMMDASYGSMSGDSDPISSRNSASSTNSLPQLPGQRQMSERELASCELRVNLAGFRSETINLGGRRLMDNPDVGTIVLHRISGVTGFTYSMTTANAPKDARKAYEKGQDLIKKKKLPEAAAQFRIAAETYPKYAEAWYELGCIQQGDNKYDEARKSFEASIDADPKFVKPYLRLANVAFNESKWGEVVQITDRVTKLDPVSYPINYYFSAIANLQLKNLEPAEKSSRELVRLDPAHRYPRGVYVLGLALAQQEKFPEALDQLRAYLQLEPSPGDLETVKKQIARLEQMVEPKPEASIPAAKPNPKQ